MGEIIAYLGESGNNKREPPGSDRNQGANTDEKSKDYFFVILSVAKNLSFKAAEIRNEAALRSERHEYS
jgi:hypothetical protein